LKAENFPQAAAEARALDGGTDAASRNDPELGCGGFIRAQTTENNETTVPGIPLLTHGVEIGPATQARRFGQLEGSHQAAEGWREPDQAPVWRA